MDRARAKNGSQQSLCHSSHMDTRPREHVKSEDRRPRGGEQWKKKESNSDGHHGAKQPERKHRTEAIGIIVSRPYTPAGVKKEREGEGPTQIYDSQYAE